MSKTTVFEVLILFVLFFILNILFFPILFLFILYVVYRKWSYSQLPYSKQLTSHTMKAAHFVGDIVQFEQCNIPRIKSNQLLIKVIAAALNPIDYKFKLEKIPFLRWLHEHYGIGFDFCGRVIDIGSKVTKFKVGDEIVGKSLDGSLQELTICNENHAFLKPKNLSHTQAASLFLAGLTSLQSLIFYGSLEGKSVLIIGASGGTGHLGVQIAKYLKAKTIVGVCSSKNSEFVKSIGADMVLEYDKESYMKSIGDLKFDLIYDTVTNILNTKPYDVYIPLLAQNGNYVAINGKGKLKMLRAILTQKISFLKQFGNENEHFLLLNNNKAEDVELLHKMAEEGKLVPTVEEYDFDKKSINSAFEHLKSHRVRGKLAIIINSK